MLETKEVEVLHWKGKLGHVQYEADMKSRREQEKYDELQARFIELEERLEIAKSDSERVAEEHAEYEAIIRRSGGMTIAEVEKRIKELVPRCSRYKQEYGSDSWQLREQVDELRRVADLYKTISSRYPRLGRLFSSDAGASSSSNPAPRTTIVDRHSPEFLERERRQMAEQRVRRSVAGQGRGASSGRGVGARAGRGRGAQSGRG